MPRPTGRVSGVVMIGPLAPYQAAYAAELSKRGYTSRSAVNESRQVARLSRWLDRPTDAVTAAADWLAVTAAADWLMSAGGVARLETYIEPWNVASIRVAERAGFDREGLMRPFAPLGDERKDALPLRPHRALTFPREWKLSVDVCAVVPCPARLLPVGQSRSADSASQRRRAD